MTRCALGLLLYGCLLPPAYVCGSDDNCRRDGEEGVCIDQTCVFEDTAETTGGPPLAGCIDQVAAGAEHTCLIDTELNARCWGSNDFDAIEPEGPENLPDLTPIPAEIGVVTAVTGAKNTCVITPGKTLWCWGDNEEQQIGGTGTKVGATIVAEGVDAVASGGKTICWLAEGGAVTCQGLTLPPTSLTASIISVGDGHACVVDTDSAVRCWGSVGSLGAAEGEAVAIGSARVVVALAHSSCALTTEGVLFCWGENDSWLQGQGVSESSPVQPLGTEAVRFAELSGRGRHVCAVTTDGEPWCWGTNTSSQVSAGLPDERRGPASIRSELTAAFDANPTIVTMAAGGNQSCAITGDGELWCWGQGLPPRVVGCD